MRQLGLVLILISSLFNGVEAADEYNPDSFVIKIYPGKITVQSPQKTKKSVAVIVYNNLQGILRAKITDHLFAHPIYFTLKTEHAFETMLEGKYAENGFIVTPLSPAYQEVPAKFGMSYYEIPEKK